MLQLISPNESHRQEWQTILSEWNDGLKRPRIFFQDSYDMLLEKVVKLSKSDDIENKIPKSSLFFLQDSETKKIIGFFWFRYNLNFRDDDKF